MKGFSASAGIAYPEDLELLQQVFDRICSDHKVKRGSIQAELVAQTAISLFHDGVLEEAALLAGLEAFLKQSRIE